MDPRVPSAVALVMALLTLLSASAAAEDRQVDPDVSGSDDVVESAEGVAEAPFSPERLSWLLPGQIGDTDMIALDLSPEEVEARLEASTALREMLEAGGKDPTRLHMAEGFDDDSPDGAYYWIDALRVDGEDRGHRSHRSTAMECRDDHASQPQLVVRTLLGRTGIPD